MTDQTDLRSLTLAELQDFLAAFPWPAFRGKQIFDWLQVKGAQSAEEMTNLPKDMRAILGTQCFISTCGIARKQVSAIDGTVKYLFRLYDGETIESVIMRYEHGLSICVSTQVGCKMGCVFCASGENGCARNLLAGEMLAQITAAQCDIGERISHVVLMGMGEPLDNYDNVLRFIKLASSPEGLNISQRKISLSTSGIVPGIYKLAEERLGVTLSVSLHAPNDTLRGQLMPINRMYPLEALLRACRDYTAATSRRISFEYAMFRGLNDGPAHAEELARLLKGMLCHVNLIAYNELKAESEKRKVDLARSDKESIRIFLEILLQKRIACTVRRSLGQDISAACGQLKRQKNVPLQNLTPKI